MKGLAITAGSNPTFLANIGNIQPIDLASKIVAHKVIQTVKATKVDTPSITNNLMKLQIAKIKATKL